MESASKTFKDSFDKAAAELKVVTPEIMKSVNKMKTDVKEEEKLKGGLADKLSIGDIAAKHKVGVEELTNQFLIGFKKEFEHTKNEKEASEIAMDHLTEDPEYYTKLKKVEADEATGSGSSGAYSAPLFGEDDEFIEKSKSETPKKVETKEATTSGSVGAYETTAVWAKSTGKKDWRGKSKTQIPGGSFVSVKKKCTTFPYCNSGDINALHLYKNESVKEAIKNVSMKLNLNESIIKSIIQFEYEKLSNKKK